MIIIIVIIIVIITIIIIFYIDYLTKGPQVSDAVCCKSLMMASNLKRVNTVLK